MRSCTGFKRRRIVESIIAGGVRTLFAAVNVPVWLPVAPFSLVISKSILFRRGRDRTAAAGQWRPERAYWFAIAAQGAAVQSNS